MKIILFMLALIAPVAATAAQEVSLSSQVFVERTRKDSGGAAKIVREKPDVVTPGDRLVFVLSYKNQTAQPATGFTVTNPIPDAVSFSNSDAPGAVLSVDGGKSWGQLESLKVAQPDGTSRPAAAADVTHIRWTFVQPIAAGAGGTVSFRGLVK